MDTIMDLVRRHDGRKLKRVREILKVKQSALAHALGEDWTQKKVSQLEDKEEIDDQLMEDIAKALRVPVDIIKNFDEAMVLNVQNNYEGANPSANNVAAQNYQCTFNPLDKLMEVVEKNEKLYERLLQAEREKVEMMSKMMEGKR